MTWGVENILAKIGGHLPAGRLLWPYRTSSRYSDGKTSYAGGMGSHRQTRMGSGQEKPHPQHQAYPVFRGATHPRKNHFLTCNSRVQCQIIIAIVIARSSAKVPTSGPRNEHINTLFMRNPTSLHRIR